MHEKRDDLNDALKRIGLPVYEGQEGMEQLVRDIVAPQLEGIPIKWEPGQQYDAPSWWNGFLKAVVDIKNGADPQVMLAVARRAIIDRMKDMHYGGSNE